jgi:hypothetical protein
MKSGKFSLVLAGVLSFICALREFILSAKLEADLRVARDLGLTNPQHDSAVNDLIRNHLIQGTWISMILSLIVFAIYRLRRSN